MTRFEIVLGFLITAATACLLMAVIIAAKAQADELPRGLGHPTGSNHWYDSGCCDKRDCEPVEPGALRRIEGGYAVRYLTSRGFIAEGTVMERTGGVRPSRDGREHACATSQRVLCVYVPVFM